MSHIQITAASARHYINRHQVNALALYNLLTIHDLNAETTTVLFQIDRMSDDDQSKITTVHLVLRTTDAVQPLLTDHNSANLDLLLNVIDDRADADDRVELFVVEFSENEVIVQNTAYDFVRDLVFARNF